MGTMSMQIDLDNNADRAAFLQNLFPSSMPAETRAEMTNRINEIDNRIQTWKLIAARQNIDIRDEKDKLRWLRRDDKLVSGKHAEEVILLRLEIMKKSLCSRIVQKVRKNFKRDIPESKEIELKETLYHLNQDKLLPWIGVAKRECVDIAKETNVMIAAIHNGLYTLSQKQMHAKVVVFLQQINHATLCCSRIIQKVFASRIEHFAEVQKSKDWFNDEWVEVIEGIKLDALSQLPSGTKLDELERQCTELFEAYLTNLQLFEEDPEMYHVLADREWLRRNIILRAEDLILLAEGDRCLISQIENIKQMAINFVGTLQEEQQIRERANFAFDLILDRIRFKNQPFSCGFQPETPNGD